MATHFDPMKIIVGKYRDGSRTNFAWIGFNMREQRFVSMTAKEIDELSAEGMEEANLKNKSEVVIAKGEMTQTQLPEDIPF